MSNVLQFMPKKKFPEPVTVARVYNSLEEVYGALLHATSNCTIVLQDISGNASLTSEFTDGNHVRHMGADGQVFREGKADYFEKQMIMHYATTAAALNLILKAQNLSPEEVAKLITPISLLEEIQRSMPAPKPKEEAQ